MWARLTDPELAESLAWHGMAYAPLLDLVAQLAVRPYAEGMFAFTSLATFVLTTAPNYRHSAGHDQVAIRFDPNGGLTTIEYQQWISATRNPSHQVVTRRTCELSEAVETIDTYALRLVMTRRWQSQPATDS